MPSPTSSPGSGCHASFFSKKKLLFSARRMRRVMSSKGWEQRIRATDDGHAFNSASPSLTLNRPNSTLPDMRAQEDGPAPSRYTKFTGKQKPLTDSLTFPLPHPRTLLQLCPPFLSRSRTLVQGHPLLVLLGAPLTPLFLFLLHLHHPHFCVHPRNSQKCSGLSIF